MHHRLHNPKQCIEYLEEVVELVPDELQRVLNIAQTVKNISICYSSIGDNAKAKEYFKKAIKISLCENEAHFLAVYPNVN
jgi:tetratricopeptide (TPR) repeat protein